MKPLIDYRNESGQILLILTVGIVALLGMVALAVDGGMIYANRRFDQNAADASSFAGAGAAAVEMQNRGINSNNFSCAGALNADKSPNPAHPLYHPINSAINAALQRAASNNFTLQYPLADQHGIEIICNSSGEKYLEVRTVISSNVRTAFAHLFYKGLVRNTVEAVARVATAYTVGGGASLTHLSKDCKTPLLFSGNSFADIDGAWTNGCLRNNGASLRVISDTHPIYHIDRCIWNTKPSKEDEWGCPLEDARWPEIVHTSQEIKKIYLEDEHQGSVLNASQVRDFWNGICGTTSRNANFVNNKLGPGRYKFIHVTGKKNEVLELTGGLYCIDGNFDVTSGITLRSTAGVTIVMLGGSVDVNGNATVNLSAPKVGFSAEFDYPNLLFYGAKFNTTTNNFNGTGSSTFDGTLWFPDGHVSLNGNGQEQTYRRVQVIADQISVNGTNSLNLIYEDDAAVVFPSRVSLVK